MSAHTAQAEIVGLLQNAGASPEVVMKFNELLLGKQHLSDWLAVPHHERDRLLSDRAESGARYHRTLVGGPR